MKATDKITKDLKLTSFEELEEKYFGKIGTPERNLYEYEASLETLSEMIKELRKSKKLTQEQLGALVGVGQAQISKIEKKQSNNLTIGTLLKLISALGANMRFVVETESNKNNLELA